MATPPVFLCGLGPLLSGPPSEGLSADNQGTDSEKRKKSTQAPDRILIFWGGMSEAVAAWPETQALHLQPGRGGGNLPRALGRVGDRMVYSGPVEPEDQWEGGALDTEFSRLQPSSPAPHVQPGPGTPTREREEGVEMRPPSSQQGSRAPRPELARPLLSHETWPSPWPVLLGTLSCRMGIKTLTDSCLNYWDPPRRFCLCKWKGRECSAWYSEPPIPTGLPAGSHTSWEPKGRP